MKKFLTVTLVFLICFCDDGIADNDGQHPEMTTIYRLNTNLTNITDISILGILLEDISDGSLCKVYSTGIKNSIPIGECTYYQGLSHCTGIFGLKISFRLIDSTEPICLFSDECAIEFTITSTNELTGTDTYY